MAGFRSLTIAVVVALAASGYAINTDVLIGSAHARDVLFVVSVVTSHVQKSGHTVRLVRGSGLGEAEWSALSAGFHPSSEPDSDANNTLLAGCFRVDEVRITGDTALVVGTLGPVPRGDGCFMLDDCGQIFKVAFERKGMTWYVLNETVAEC